MYECYVCMHVCVPNTYLVPVGGHKSMPDSMNLELQMIMSNHVSAGNKTWVEPREFCLGEGGRIV